jgi:(p)ppGpp synthase/HD superfamily hydrolase
MAKEKLIVNALLKKELNEYLIQTGIYEQIKKGEIKCSNCGKTINEDNIFLILKKEDGIEIFCKDKGCIENEE